MARQYRFDRCETRPPQKRKDGSVRFDAVLTRTGVFEYQQADGTKRREYRSPEEVGRADSLASLELAHFVIGHPAAPGLAKGLAVGSVGDSIKFDGRYVSGSVIVRDDAAIKAIERGDAAETSCGYSIDYVPKPGVSPEGEAYDGLQTNIEYEHVAGVPRGRAGSSVRLRTDAADGWRADAAVMVDACWPDVRVVVHSASLSSNDLDAAVRLAIASQPNVTIQAPPKYDAVDATVKAGTYYEPGIPPGRATVHVSTRELSLNALTAVLKTGLASVDAVVGPQPDPATDAAAIAARAAATPPRIDRADSAGQEIHVMDEMKKKLDAALAEAATEKARADAAEKKLAEANARADKAEGERDAQKTRADQAEKARADAADNAMPRARERIKLEDTAAKVLGAEFKLDGDDTAIKVAVIEKLSGEKLPEADAKRVDYVAGRYDAAIKVAGESVAAGAQLRAAANETTRTDTVESEADAAKKMRARNAALSQNTPPARS